MAAPTTVQGNGMVVATGLGAQHAGHVQNMEGGLVGFGAGCIDGYSVGTTEG